MHDPDICLPYIYVRLPTLAGIDGEDSELEGEDSELEGEDSELDDEDTEEYLQQLSLYEQQREERIKHNQQKLQQLLGECSNIVKVRAELFV